MVCKIYVDTTIPESIKECIDKLQELGIKIAGVTTNPLVFCSEYEGKNVKYGEVLIKVIEASKLTHNSQVFLQPVGNSETMVVLGKKYHKIAKEKGVKAIIKLPVNDEGYNAIKTLNNEGISTMATACMSASQAKTVATYNPEFLAFYLAIGTNARN